MKIETITKMAESLKPGEKMAIATDKKQELEKLLPEHGLLVVDGYIDQPELLMVKKAKIPGAKSRYAEIIEILSQYKTGSVEIPGEEPSYVRTVASQFNQRTGQKFKVTEVNGNPQIFLEIEDREYITDQEMNTIRAKYNTKMAEMELKIMPAEFFGDNEYTEPDPAGEHGHPVDDNPII
ncbi:MAG: hypothetical protein KAU20_00525 [Nanoarchaeota archaeon]|nr:hypothetical protein [Nanoarchaeota archaeon]